MADLQADAVPHHDNPANTQEVLIEYVKEKDTLKADLKEKEKEIQQYKAKVYDLTEKVQALQKEIKHMQKESSRQLPTNNSSSQVPPNKLGVVRPTTGKSRTPVMKRAKSSKQRQKPSAKVPTSISIQAEGTPEPVSPVDMRKYKTAVETVDHLHEVAEKYPELKLSVIFSSEKFFQECDVNNDGTIDEDELEKLLSKQGHLYTSKELKEIMSQIDVDNNNSIDLMEYLAVMERVQQRKRTNLPQALTRSAACVIQ